MKGPGLGVRHQGMPQRLIAFGQWPKAGLNAKPLQWGKYDLVRAGHVYYGDLSWI